MNLKNIISDNIQIEILNLNGAMLASYEYNLKDGLNSSFEIPLECLNLPDGYYIAKISSGASFKALPFIIVK
jgi:hypothetical protein